jgi:hypothetical protein
MISLQSLEIGIQPTSPLSLRYSRMTFGVRVSVLFRARLALLVQHRSRFCRKIDV